MEYTILYDTAVHRLIESVNAFLDRGWTPQGGVCKDDTAFYQCLVRVKRNVRQCERPAVVRVEPPRRGI